MLSINIPVYQIEVSGLVNQLKEQAEKLDIPYEIRIYDDGSNREIKEVNRKTENLPNVIYREMTENLGRSAIRNKMGQDSKFTYLLFIDADSSLTRENYLSDYINNVKANRVVCGGTAYQPKPPAESEKLLRWIYGTLREAVSAEIRNQKKGFIITSNNFLIEKSVFEQTPFRKDIKSYGHEDTLLGYDLHRKGIEIFHIDNPVEHTGLEDSFIFLEKTKTALQNLHFITNKIHPDDKELVGKVHFLKFYSSLSKYLPPFLLRRVYRIFKSAFEKDLTGKDPSLFLFDLYKLTYYSTLK